MLSYLVTGLMATLSMASTREAIRPIPTITNSLVNLGKMEVSFYFNESPAHHSDRPSKPNTPFFLQNSNPEPALDEPCPCSSIRNIKDSFLNNPTGLLNKILTHNDLFSYNKEPITSSLCCESHEQENTVVFEFPNNNKIGKPFASRSNSVSAQSNTLPMSNNGMPLPIMPFLIDSFIPNKSLMSPMKTKSIEIFLFPKKKNIGPEKKQLTQKKDLKSKDNIQIVGDKELRNDILLFKPELPIVKKDLDLQEKKEKDKIEMEKEKEKREMEKEKEKEKYDIEKEGDQIIIEPGNKPNAV